MLYILSTEDACLLKFISLIYIIHVEYLLLVTTPDRRRRFQKVTPNHSAFTFPS